MRIVCQTMMMLPGLLGLLMLGSPLGAQAPNPDPKKEPDPAALIKAIQTLDTSFQITDIAYQKISDLLNRDISTTETAVVADAMLNCVANSDKIVLDGTNLQQQVLKVSTVPDEIKAKLTNTLAAARRMRKNADDAVGNKFFANRDVLYRLFDKLGEQKMTRTLAKIVGESKNDPLLRRAAIRALGELVDSKDWDDFSGVFIQASGEASDRDLRLETVVALGNLAGKTDKRNVAQQVADLLFVRATQDDDADVRLAACKALGNLPKISAPVSIVSPSPDPATKKISSEKVVNKTEESAKKPAPVGGTVVQPILATPAKKM